MDFRRIIFIEMRSVVGAIPAVTKVMAGRHELPICGVEGVYLV